MEKNDFEELEQLLSELKPPRPSEAYLEKLSLIPTRVSAQHRSVWQQYRLPLGIAACVAVLLTLTTVTFVTLWKPSSANELSAGTLVQQGTPSLAAPSESEARGEPGPAVLPKQSVQGKEDNKVVLTLFAKERNPRVLIYEGAEKILPQKNILEIAIAMAKEIPVSFTLDMDLEAESDPMEWKCKLTPREAFYYQSFSEDSYRVARNDLGLAETSDGRVVRFYQEIWIDKQIAINRFKGKNLEIVQARMEPLIEESQTKACLSVLGSFTLFE